MLKTDENHSGTSSPSSQSNKMLSIIKGNSKETSSSEESPGARRISLGRSSTSNQGRKSSIFGGRKSTGTQGLEMLDFDISEAINEDENSKKKNNNLIIETKETLMEKQGRRDLVKLQVSRPI